MLAHLQLHPQVDDGPQHPLPLRLLFCTNRL
jgi:hypothetical protein